MSLNLKPKLQQDPPSPLSISSTSETDSWSISIGSTASLIWAASISLALLSEDVSSDLSNIYIM